jgi:D-amino-acid dehydrogenase
MNKIVIAGAGIMGLFTAYYLVREGREVILIDKERPNVNCSSGNAGMIVPSHVIPLAAPGVVSKGIRWIMSSGSPFSVKFRFSREWIQWGWIFYRSANKRHVDKNFMPLRNISMYSKELYLSFMENHADQDFLWKEKGLLMLYKSIAGEKDEINAAKIASAAGLKPEILSLKDVRKYEPSVNDSVRGGVLYPEDATLSPSLLTGFLYRYLEANGVRIINRQEVISVVTRKRKVLAVKTKSEEIPCRYLIICAGAYSSQLARQLSLNMPIMAGKGYSFMVPNSMGLSQPAILSEKKVTVSPFGRNVRFGGTMEITDFTAGHNPVHVRNIAGSINEYYTSEAMVVPDMSSVWSGLRPVSPDGLPYIGPTSLWKNVLFGTGHSMIGISLAPATGKILAGFVSNRKPLVSIENYSPDRFTRLRQKGR